MDSLNEIREKIKKLYEIAPNIHINVSVKKPKIFLNNEPAVIKGVYPRIFQIEEQSSGYAKTHSLQYTEVLLHHIDIVELEDLPSCE